MCYAVCVSLRNITLTQFIYFPLLLFFIPYIVTGKLANRIVVFSIIIKNVINDTVCLLFNFCFFLSYFHWTQVGGYFMMSIIYYKWHSVLQETNNRLTIGKFILIIEVGKWFNVRLSISSLDL